MGGMCVLSSRQLLLHGQGQERVQGQVQVDLEQGLVVAPVREGVRAGAVSRWMCTGLSC
jgi:hypothetical protein